MLDVTTPEFHHWIRLLSKRVILWTEMVVDETIVFTNDLDHHMAISSPNLHPIICQIGGRSSEYCATATQVVRRYGYQEVNLNVDCPSSRVSGKRQFGAILMSKEHQQTCYEVVSAMKDSSEFMECENCVTPTVPISVKTRLGIETKDGTCYDDLEYVSDFIENLSRRGCKRFFIHARKCVIGGLTPTENRLVPPLNYPRFYSLCQRFPDCEFILNGGIPGLEAARMLCYGDDRIENHSTAPINEMMMIKHTVPCKICNALNGSCTAPQHKDSIPSNIVGCMIGRACMDNPAMFWDIDRYFYGMEKNPCQTRGELLEKYCVYLERTYPRRCCDSDERITKRIPAPSIELSPGGCDICNEFYGDKNGVILSNNCASEGAIINNFHVKISSKVIDRSLKPVLGIFFGLPRGKTFRRECDRLSRDTSIRNCGPGYILRKALKIMPDHMLKQLFVKTEDLTDIPTHFSPESKSSNIKRCNKT